MHAHAPATPRLIDDSEFHRRQGISQRAFHRSLAEGSPGGFVVQRAGDVQATVVPAASRLAILNSVFYADREALGAVLEELGAIYREAGVSGWTVWVPPWDRPAARLLRAAGHSRSGAVMVTAALLAELDLEPEMEIDLDPCASAELAARCNDRAHGLAEG